jgi:hypothetical protein
MKTITTTIHPVLAMALLAWTALSPMAKAVIPTPDGGYAGGNTAEGTAALLSRVTGNYNTAVGLYSLLSLADGNFNTGVGAGTLLANTAGQNTATGAGALLSNTTGSENTGVGTFALFFNTTGVDNTGIGDSALLNNTEGSLNTAVGEHALVNNTQGLENTASGVSALSGNTAGGRNTGNGVEALSSNTTGQSNTASGYRALAGNVGQNFNTAHGAFALEFNTGGNNTALGYLAGRSLTTGSNNIDIGNQGIAAESDTVRIGDAQTKTFIAGISGTTVAGTAVVVNGNGQLGVAPSSQRFKDQIKSMADASEVIYALKPVTFRYKQKIDPQATSQFGLVAEEVEMVNPDLVVRDKEGKPYSVRYDQVNAMLLNEFLKAHLKIEELEATVVRQQKSFEATLSEHNKQIEALTLNLQKLGAQSEMTHAASSVATNKP